MRGAGSQGPSGSPALLLATMGNPYVFAPDLDPNDFHSRSMFGDLPGFMDPIDDTVHVTPLVSDDDDGMSSNNGDDGEFPGLTLQPSGTNATFSQKSFGLWAFARTCSGSDFGIDCNLWATASAGCVCKDVCWRARNQTWDGLFQLSSMLDGL